MKRFVHTSQLQTVNGQVAKLRITQEFKKNTLIPHLEEQIIKGAPTFTPYQLSKITNAYSRVCLQGHKPGKEILHYLIMNIKERISGFQPADIIDVIQPLYQFAPDDEVLYNVFAERILLYLEDFSALNLIGILSTYSQVPQTPATLLLLKQATPRIRALLENYDPLELSVLLVSAATSGSAQKNAALVDNLLPIMVSKLQATPLQAMINNLWALTKMRVVQEELWEKVLDRIKTREEGKSIPLHFLLRLLYTAFELQKSQEILELVKDQIHVDNINGHEFLKLVSSLWNVDKDICRQARKTVDAKKMSMPRREYSAFFMGLVMMQELQSAEAIHEYCSYFKREIKNFERQEIYRLASALVRHNKRILNDLPPEFAESLAE